MRSLNSPLALALMRIPLPFLTFAVFACALAPAVAGDCVGEKSAAGYFPLVYEQAAADIFVADDDWTVAQIADVSKS